MRGGQHRKGIREGPGRGEKGTDEKIGERAGRSTEDCWSRSKAESDCSHNGALTSTVRADDDVEARARAKGDLVVRQKVRQSDAKDAAELVAVRTHAEKIKISKYNCVGDTVSGREGRVTQGKAKCDETQRNTTDGNTNTGSSAIGAGPSPPIRRFFNSGSGPLVSSGAARRIERQRS